MNNIILKGESIQELLYYIENQEDENMLPDGISYEPEFTESNETLSVSLAAIAISGLAGVISSVLIEFFKKKITQKAQNEITYTRLNEKGEEIKITLSNLTIENVESEVKKFMKN